MAVLAGCANSRQAARSPFAMDPSVVAVIGGDPLTLDEFEARYARSVGSREVAANDSLPAYRDFLDRYVDFRLKVMAAEAAGLDTSAQVVQEAESYRTNLARPFLLEQEVIEPIVRDLYERQQELIEVSHVLLRVQQNAPPADTLAVYERMRQLEDSLAQGVPFDELAFKYSEDPSARGRAGSPGYRGHLGYITAGRVVEPFEDMAYATPVGSVSPIFRTEFGYHILKVHDRRPAMGEIRVAHIMLRVQPTAEDSARVRALMEELQGRIAAGESFAELARQYSDDRGSAANGGDLNFIRFDMPVAPFRDAAFALENPGDVSDIVETSYGFHLIELLERKSPPTYDEAYAILKQTAARLPRARAAEVELAREVLRQTGARVDTAFVEATLRTFPADSMLQALLTSDLPAETNAHVVLTLGDSTYTFADLSDFARQARLTPTQDAHTLATELLTQFTTARAIDYEAGRLEQRDEEFRRVMQEFRDGLVLFKLMEDSVWTAAERDSAALLAHFEQHRDSYWFPDRTRIIGLHHRSDSVLAATVARLDAGTSLADFIASVAADSAQAIRIDTLLIADATGSIYDQALHLTPGQHTTPLQNRGGYVVLINDGILPAAPKTFEEARPEVVSQYQQVLETSLLQRLRRHYGVQLYPERLSAAFKNESAVTTTGSAASN